MFVRLHSSRQTPGLLALLGLLFFGLGLAGTTAPPSDKEESARIAKATEHFQSLVDTAKQFQAKMKPTVTATVTEERLRMAKEKSSRWSCEDALSRAKEDSKAARKELGTLSERLKTKWEGAKQAAGSIEASRLPWGSDAQLVTDSVNKARELFKLVNSSKTAQGAESIARLWERTQEYARIAPSCLPQAKAEDLVPATVRVPCTMEVVKMR